MSLAIGVLELLRAMPGFYSYQVFKRCANDTFDITPASGRCRARTDDLLVVSHTAISAVLTKGYAGHTGSETGIIIRSRERLR